MVGRQHLLRLYGCPSGVTTRPWETGVACCVRAASGALALVYKFSKFQHGMAFLHREKIASGLLPHWLQIPVPPQPQQADEEHATHGQRPGHGRVPLGASLFESVRNSADSLLTPLARSFADQHHQWLPPAGAVRRKRRSLFPPGPWTHVTLRPARER